MSTGWLVGFAIGLALGVTVTLIITRRTASRSERELDTILQQTEAELEGVRRSSDEYREVQDLILSSMRDGLLLLDEKGRTAFANDAYTQHLGLIPPDASSLFPVGLRELVGSVHGGDGRPMPTVVEVGSPSRWLQVQATAAGGEGAVLIVVRDVTEARKLEATRRDFVANASHELKTPASSIRAVAETLSRGAIDDPPAARRFTEQLEREALRLSRIVADLLDLSRLEAGSALEDMVRIDAIATDEVERLEEAAGFKGVALTLHAAPVPEVRGSSRELALLIRNLVDNAIRYTPEGGSVDVIVESEGREVSVSVADTGIGIPQNELPRIFERFYRVDRARSRETGGTGLGLSIVRHAIENHGGRIDVTSDLGVGTTFRVTLPAAASTPARATT